MNDLDLIRDLGTALDPEPVTPPARMRARFVRTLSEPAGRRIVPARRRTAWLTATAVTAAVAIAFAAVAVAPTVRQRGGEGQGAPPDTVAAETTELDGEQILLAAAARAAAEPFEPPGDDEYVYTRSQILDAVEPRQESDSELWLPVDPARRWMIHDRLITGADDGRTGEELTMVFSGCAPQAAKRSECALDPGYLADLPDTPEAMLRVLRGEDGEKPWTASASPVMNAYQLLVGREVPPDARAVIFRALTLLPEHEVVRGVETLAGKTGTAVAVTSTERRDNLPAEIWEIADSDESLTVRDELVLDPETHELLAYRLVLAGERAIGGLVPGDVLIEHAVVDHGVVDDLRIRPDGTRHEGEVDHSA
jgi:hypothetical protein